MARKVYSCEQGIMNKIVKMLVVCILYIGIVAAIMS